MRGVAVCLASLVLCGCERAATPEERAEDVAEGTARAVATEVSADQYREIDDRLDRLEDNQRHLLKTEGILLNEVQRLENNQRAANEWAVNNFRETDRRMGR